MHSDTGYSLPLPILHSPQHLFKEPARKGNLLVMVTHTSVSRDHPARCSPSPQSGANMSVTLQAMKQAMKQTMKQAMKQAMSQAMKQALKQAGLSTGTVRPGR